MKQDIRKLLGTGKLIMGTECTVKALREGGLKQVVLSSNCSAEVLNLVDELKGSTEVVTLTENNEELGVICKKPFRIAVLGIKA